MKKILYKLFIATLILFSTAVVSASNEVYYTNKNNINMTESEYNNLLELGFTEKQINRMDYDTFIDNKDINATLVSETKMYYKTTTTWRNGISYHTSEILTEEEFMDDLKKQKQQPTNPTRISGNFYDSISYTDYKMITARIAYVSDIYMRYKVDTDWFQIPSMRSYDIMAIGIEPSKVEIGSNIVFRQDYITTSGNDGYGLACSPKEQSTGGSVLFKLPTGSLSELQSYMYFNVKKKAGVGTITGLVAAGDYAHAIVTTSTNAYNYYTVNHAGGIIVSNPYLNSYDTMPEAYASFLGSW